MSTAPVAARPLAEEDGEALRAVDQAYALRHELEPALTRSSLAFFLRSGHAFAAYLGDEPKGFALAQAIWNGTRPTVFLSRLTTDRDKGDAAKVLAALIHAVTKSAYDAAVYDLVAQVPTSDHAAAAVLAAAGYGETPLRLYSRILGTRGQG